MISFVLDEQICTFQPEIEVKYSQMKIKNKFVLQLSILVDLMGSNSNSD